MLQVLCPLTLGALLYLWYRPGEVLGFRWLEGMGAGSALKDLRSLDTRATLVLPRVLIDSLPGGLWVYSFTMALGAIWSAGERTARFSWLLVPIFIGVGSEVAQGIEAVGGTFDPYDLALYGGFYALARLVLCPALQEDRDAQKSR